MERPLIYTLHGTWTETKTRNDWFLYYTMYCTHYTGTGNHSYGSFPPTETDSDSDLDSDSKPYHYIVLCTTFSTGSDSDPCMESFLNGYCTHFRDGSLSQGSESESISVGGNEPLPPANEVVER